MIRIENHSNTKIWSFLKGMQGALFWSCFWAYFWGGFGVCFVVQIGSKMDPKSHPFSVSVLVFRALRGFQVASGCRMGLSKVILRPRKARKRLLFACLKPSTYSLLGACHSCSGLSWSVLSTFGFQNGLQKCSKRNPKVAQKVIQNRNYF